MSRYQPATREQLRQAIVEYCLDDCREHGPIGTWDTSLITDMTEVYYNMNHFNESIADWDTSLVTNMKHIFHGCTSFNQPLSSWNTSSVINMDNMFEGCTSFHQPMGSWHKPQMLFQDCPDPDYCCTVCSDKFVCK